MFVTPDQLKFDLADLIESAIQEWSVTQPLGFTRPLVESCGDFIVDELTTAGLRVLDGSEARFSKTATFEEFRECVYSALDHWLIRTELQTKRSAEEMEDYRRPCGE